MKNEFQTYLIIGLLILGIVGLWTFKKERVTSNLTVGQKIDSLNGVYVYYNNSIDNVSGRNTTTDGYNLGLKYQCVEFVKRYYYEHLKHKMLNSFGNAKDFFDSNLRDAKYNKKRDLTQYSNPSSSKPKIGDLLIFSGSIFNKYGHVAIISNVKDNEIEIIQQNPGPYGNSREIFPLVNKNGKWEIQYTRIIGWLRKN